MDWEVVYTEMLPRVYNYFRYHGLEDAVVEDLTAITFEKAWRKRSSYRHDLAAFSTWLLRIAHNVAMDYYRSRPQEIKLADYEIKAGQSSPEDMPSSRTTWRTWGGCWGHSRGTVQALKYGSG
jgi:RNA polymerase sigma-70 factor (ECF subfamily)